MPAQKPQWFFQPRSHRNGTGTGDGDSAAGQTTVPAAVLRRHGARVLEPEKAAAVHGFPSPQSTVYRARTLLIPGGLLQHAPKVRAINEILDDVGMTLIPGQQWLDFCIMVDQAEWMENRKLLLERSAIAPAIDAWVAEHTVDEVLDLADQRYER